MPRKRKTPSAPSVAPATPATPPVQPDTVRVVVDLAARVYADERDRLKVLDTKAGLLLSATSAIIALLLTILIKPPDVIVHVPARLVALPAMPARFSPNVAWLLVHAGPLYYWSVLLTIAILFIAQLYFVRAVRLTEALRLDLPYWVDYATLRRESVDVQAELAAAYDDAVSGNKHVYEKKVTFVGRGSLALVAGIGVLGLVPVMVIVLLDVLE